MKDLTDRQWLIVLVVAWSVALVLGLVFLFTWSAWSHELYGKIYNFAGINCCNGQDCRQVYDPQDIIPTSTGYRLNSTGESVPLPYTGISPDEHWHICRFPTGDVRCLLVPPNGS